jgi:hypothetical protein
VIRVRGLLPIPNLRSPAVRIVFSFFCVFCAFSRHFQFSSSLCAFASLADVAKGEDRAKSALREIFPSAFFAFFVPFCDYSDFRYVSFPHHIPWRPHGHMDRSL